MSSGDKTNQIFNKLLNLLKMRGEKKLYLILQSRGYIYIYI